MKRLMIGATALLAGLATGLPVLAHTDPVVATPAPATDARLAGLLADYEAYLRSVDPVTSGLDGDRAALARLPDVSRTAELARLAPLRALLTRTEAITPDGLSAADARNRAFVLFLLRREIEGITLDTGRLAFNSEGGFGQTAAYFASSTRIAGRDDAEAWLARLAAMPRLFDDTLANARRGLATGLAQPASVVASALLLARTDAGQPLDADVLLTPLADLPDSIPAADQTALRDRARAIVSEQIAPRRLAWLAFLTDEAVPAAPVAPGLGLRPGGREMYAYFVRGFTTTDLTPDQVHQIGVDEVARIRARMDTEMRAAGWTGDFAGFLAFLRSDPQFYATSREDLLEKASEMAKRSDDHLPALFGTLPRLTYGVRPVPAAIEDSYTTGRYNGGSMKTGVAGGYMVNTSHLDQRPLYELPALTLHEAVPGHHLQIALQQEAGDQPYFRRGADVTAFIEGWGLYSEYLGEEMGFYRTPYERFGRLSYEMWRACRLVADTGIHWMGWSTEQARACFRDNSALSALNIETELQRYIGWPGQATAYKIGEIRLRAIRARAEAALGDRFDIRTFHDALLVDGPLPLDLLDARMDAWIAEQAVR
ncbi:MAG: DUF885 domain-containing protein [Brevundimonas sp.]|jgi:uncharacterized protein (DUF885 family)